MKYTAEQLILAASVRALAIDIRMSERNALSDKWHSENPGEVRELVEFSKELNKTKSFADFIAQAVRELENIADIMMK